ncbi:acyl-CoA dehydrogenase [Pseudomonas tructae]|uniref:Acyl-CoA dehydrogenase n=1 Tax=Pseudomonas tructae TaxID=2518644 RepID=A0A411MJS5_9PSED|nr:acyl-CoA dehydrogenase [Pseudomonas tructae]QBF27052.1 acyl-CoA dehydrogenase [Pseudomonas tructae]
MTPRELLQAFARRPQALNLDRQLQRCLEQCRESGFDQLPLPGHGRTLQRWQVLAEVAGIDLALAKLFEGHTDALAILHECGASHLAPAGSWGVWAAEPPNARVRIVRRNGNDVHLQGRKAWCSGALQIDRALLTAWDEQERPQLVAVALDQPALRIFNEGWQAIGMAVTASVDVEFNHCPAQRVGSSGQYLSRPGFWHGGGGIAACWYGAAQTLGDVLLDHCRHREEPHAQAHLGAVDAALAGARAALREAAEWIDGHPGSDAELVVRRLRAQVEGAALGVLDHVGRALGATPFCRDSHFARLSADLPVFLRQSHAERDLAELGRQLSATPEGGWRL